MILSLFFTESCRAGDLLLSFSLSDWTYAFLRSPFPSSRLTERLFLVDEALLLFEPLFTDLSDVRFNDVIGAGDLPLRFPLIPFFLSTPLPSPLPSFSLLLPLTFFFSTTFIVVIFFKGILGSEVPV
jgi:hypothetical protein